MGTRDPTGMGGFIICKFHMGKQGNPINLVVVHETVKILFKDWLIHFICPLVCG